MKKLKLNRNQLNALKNSMKKIESWSGNAYTMPCKDIPSGDEVYIALNDIKGVLGIPLGEPLKYKKSVECCCECGDEMETVSTLTKCPSCGSINASCAECVVEFCDNCFHASNFEQQDKRNTECR